MKMRSLGIVMAAGFAVTAEPAMALSHHDWEVVSTIGVVGLGATALGAPAVQGDFPGLLQAGGSILVGGGTAYGLKQIIHEQRPDGSGNDSFPSAHTALAFASAATLNRRYGWQVGIPATLVATLVGFSRVQARRHHWYDAVAGAAIGEASGLLITRPINGNARLVPWGDSKGGGLAFAMRF